MKYTKAFEIAELATRELRHNGWRFEPGVERTLALAAVPTRTEDEAALALEKAIYANGTYIRPSWNGSIA